MTERPMSARNSWNCDVEEFHKCNLFTSWFNASSWKDLPSKLSQETKQCCALDESVQIYLGCIPEEIESRDRTVAILAKTGALGFSQTIAGFGMRGDRFTMADVMFACHRTGAHPNTASDYNDCRKLGIDLYNCMAEAWNVLEDPCHIVVGYDSLAGNTRKAWFHPCDESRPELLCLYPPGFAACVQPFLDRCWVVRQQVQECLLEWNQLPAVLAAEIVAFLIGCVRGVTSIRIQAPVPHASTSLLKVKVS